MPGNNFFIFKCFPDADTVKRVYVDTVRKVVEDPTMKALYDSREFYEDSMNKVLVFLGIAVTVFIGLFAWKVFWDVSGSKKFSKSLIEGLNKKIKQIDDKSKKTESIIEKQTGSIKKAFITPCLETGAYLYESNARKPSSEAFSQYISALYYIQILIPAESDFEFVKEILAGLNNNWRAVGAIGKHPVIDPLEKLLGAIDESEWENKLNKRSIQDSIRSLLGDVVEGGSNVFVTAINGKLVPKDESETNAGEDAKGEKEGKES